MKKKGCSEAQIKANITAGKSVLIDPGRRDLLYCMDEDITVDNTKVHRFTRNQKTKERKSNKFKKQSQQLKPNNVQECENKLSQCSASTVKKEPCIEYLKIRSQVTFTLRTYYYNEDVEKDQRKPSLIPFRKLKLSSSIYQIQSNRRLSKEKRRVSSVSFR